MSRIQMSRSQESDSMIGFRNRVKMSWILGSDSDDSDSDSDEADSRIDFLHNKTQKRPNTEPQGIPGALDWSIRHKIKF